MGSDLEAIFNKLDEISAGQEFIVKKLRLQPDTVRVKDIYLELDCARSTIWEKRWLLPYFGQSQYPTGPARWDEEIWESWKDWSETQRRKAWETKTTAEFLEIFEAKLT